MSNPLQNLQGTFSDILKDMMSMSADVIKKSDIHLNDVTSLDLISVDKVSDSIRILIERVNTNMGSFKDQFNTAITNYKSTVKSENVEVAVTPEKRVNLSLKRNGDTQDTDIDLTNSDAEEDLKESPTKHLEIQESFLTKEEMVTPEKTKNKNDECLSDTDSEKTIGYFDVPVTTEPVEDGDELGRVLEEFDKIADNKEAEPKEDRKQSIESMSFDFDDMSEKDVKDEESAQHNQKENHELLELLNQAMGEDGAPVEEDVNEALKILDDDISLSAYSDSDDSVSSDGSGDEWEPERQRSNEDSESEGTESDVESSAEEPEVELKSFKIDMERLDQLGEAAIERLCNLHNINKRKCLKQLNKLKKRKRRRIRLLTSSSSSSSLSSDLSSSGSATPDLPLGDQDQPPPPDIQLADVTALADEFADKLQEDNIEISSDTSTDAEAEEPKKKKRKVQVKNEDDDVQIIENDEKEKRKKRVDCSLWSDSDDESVDEKVVVLNDPLKIDDDDDVEDVDKPSDETHIISDSDSSSDSDDVTFVDESFDSGGKGRRNIRAVLSDDDLSELTQQAKTEEDERIMRLEEHSKNLESIQSQHEAFVLDVDVKTGAPLISVDYNLSKILKPHQKEGVQFMWEACYESVEMLKTKPGTGCILAHCMGLGKTLQVITLIHTLFTHQVTNTKHVLIICPLSTVINWQNEFKKTFRLLDDQPDIQQFFIVKGDISHKIKTMHVWRKNGGVLVMGYETFQILTNDRLADRVTVEEKKIASEALLDPGPDLVVCDEAHQLKNGRTKKTMAVMRIRTKRRIALTGTPLQNNLQEYYFMVQFVKPHLLGTHKEYNNRFAAPITNGQYHDSRPEDIKLMKKRTHVLTKLLKKTIHRVEAGILASYLPEMKDYTVFVKLTALQMDLYTHYINMIKQATNLEERTFFHDVMILTFNSLHPYTLQLYYNKPKPKKKKKQTDEILINDNEIEATDEVTYIRKDWYKAIFPADVSTNVNYSWKLKVVLDMIDQIVANGEKALIFAQYLVELDLLEHFFKLCKAWRRDVHYYRMDGETPIEERDQLCKQFNSIPSVRIFLLTHRVGGLGLNLTGANRVMMIGSNHNPTLDTQSMYRVYRFGQEKKCSVYRMLSLATMEEKIYHRCVVKLHLSGTVVDKLHFVRHYRSTDLQEMYTVDFSEYTKDRPIPVVPTDKLLALMLQNYLAIYKYHLHNSLLENRPEEELTDEDKKLAWDEFNSMEEAAKQVVATAQAFAKPITSLSGFPLNVANPYNRPWRHAVSNIRSHAPTLVPNPLNNNSRGFIPRGFLTNGVNTHLQNLNRFTNPQSNPPRQNNPQSALPRQNNPHLTSPRQNNPFLNLFDQNTPQTSGHGRNAGNAVMGPREVLQRLIPAAHRLQGYAQTVRERSRDVVDVPTDASSGGEFNYALNKVV